MKTIIAGGRDVTDPAHLAAALASCPWKPSAVICGEARGADTLGKQWAHDSGLPVHSYRANWDLHGKHAGPLRNLDMLDHPAEALIALWDGKSRGTANMIAIAKARGIPVHIHLLNS